MYILSMSIYRKEPLQKNTQDKILEYEFSPEPISGANAPRNIPRRAHNL